MPVGLLRYLEVRVFATLRLAPNGCGANLSANLYSMRDATESAAQLPAIGLFFCVAKNSIFALSMDSLTHLSVSLRNVL